MRKNETFSLGDILLPYQWRFVRDPSRRKIWVSARQVGKSFSIAFLMCLKVLERKGAVGLCVSTGARAASELLKKCRAMAEAIRIVSRGRIDYTYSCEAINFNTGSRLISLPNNPDAVRGYTASVVCIDEAAFIMNLEDIYQAIAPTLTRDPRSELILCSTPAGCNGLFYELYQDALTNEDWYVQTTDIEEAVRQGLKVDIGEIRKMCPDQETFDQEYMCRFSKEYGSFVDFDLVDFYDEIPAGQFGYYLGMDVGRKHDRSAITIVKQVADKLYLENVVTLSKCPYSEQIQIVKDLDKKYQFKNGLIDEGGIGSAVAEQVTKTVTARIKGIQFTASNKTRLYEAVRAGIFDHRMVFNPDYRDILKKDFDGVRRVVTEAGQVKFEAGRDESGHSDVCSSLTLAVEANRLCPLSMEAPRTHVNASAFGPRRRLF